MRVLLLVDSYLPSTKAGAKLMHDLAVELARLKHEVVLAAPEPSLGARHKVSHADGVTVLRVRSGRMKGAPKVLRALNELRLSRTMWRAGKGFFAAHPADLIVFYSPTIFFGGLVRRLKRQWGASSYLVLRDIFPQWAVDAGQLREGGPVHRLFRRIELRQYAVTDVIGVQSEANLSYFENLRQPAGCLLEVLHNWMQVEGDAVPATDFRKSLNLTGKVVFVYGGNLGVAQDLDNLLRLASRLRSEDDFHMLLVGEGSERRRVEQEILRREMANVTIHPAVDQETYLGMLSEFDVGLISLDRELKTQNFPGKMLGYMFCSLPILASINPGNDLRDVLEEHDAGLVCRNGDDDGLHRQALRLLEDRRLRARIGCNGRRLLEEKFSVTAAAERILAHMR